MDLSPLRRLVLSAALALSASACATLGNKQLGDPDYAADAESNLKKGNDALSSKNFLEAEKYFEHVRTKYPFLEAANEAELRLADTDFERDQFIEARDRYTNFVKLHPTHAKVDYAAYRAALTHYREIPSDLFILPPAKEKDQAAVRATVAAMTDFLKGYPDSTYVKEAQGKADEAKRRLAEHELYVAAFYRRRDKWPAVVGRLKKLVTDYPGLGYEEEGYFGLHEAYSKMKDEARAKEALRSLVQKLPGTRAAARAQRLLGAGG